MLSGCAATDDDKELGDLFSSYSGASSPGAAVAVIRNGEVVIKRTYGLQSVETGAPITSSTNFRLASVTKQFTAAAILRLIESGELSLSTTLADLYDDFPAYGKTVNVGHLLTHTSGLIDYENVMADTLSAPILDGGVLDLMMAQDSTYFAPGTQYRYSNSAYAVLAMIVEKASGVSFADYLRMHLFEPAGMTSTVAFQDGVSTVPNRAYGHSLVDGDFVVKDQSMTSSVLGDGGVYSSIDDLQRWYEALDDGRIVGGQLLRSSTEAQPGTTHEEGAGYGFGWFVESYNGVRNVRHSGSTIGFRNDVERFPDLGLTVIVLTNRNGPDVVQLARDVAGLYAEEL